MGVIALTSLVEVNPHLLSDVELRDTDLIIDGYSFCYQLYNIIRIDSRYGGDYPTFESRIIDCLDQFEWCGIRPTFIFDGLLDVENLKRSTAISRQKTRLFTAKSLSEGGPRANLLPLFAKDVLMDTLRRRRPAITIYQCAGEADAIAVGLANTCRAPLLSQDSDFFIFDLEFGYIPFETVEWLTNDEGAAAKRQNHLSAKLYRLDNLLAHYPNVNRRLLPLFAFLCGNDFSSGFNMDKFLDHIHKPRVQVAGYGGESSANSGGRNRKQGGVVRPMRRHCNMIAVLEWLGGKEDEQKAIDEVLQWIELKRREKVKEALQRSMDAYRRCEQFGGDNRSSSFDAITAVIRRNISHLDLPEWLIDGYITGEVPAAFLQIRQDKSVFLQPLIENFPQRPSVYDCCRMLRRSIYRILLKQQRQDSASSGGTVVIREYCRDGCGFATKLVKIDDDKDESDLSSSFPDLAEIERLSIAERQGLFLQCFQLPSSAAVENFPDFLIPFAASFLFWCNSADVRFEQGQAARALFFCCFWLCNRRRAEFAWTSDDSVAAGDDDALFRKFETECDHAPGKVANAASAKQQKQQQHEGSWLEIENLHSLSQWQACFQAAQWLHAILMRPFGDTTTPAQFIFHGRVLYNLAIYFTKNYHSKTSGEVERIFDRCSPALRQSFEELWSLVEHHLPPASTTNSVSGGRSGGKAKQRKKNRGKKTASNKSSADDGNAESGFISDEETQRGAEEDDGLWGLENRFRALVTLKKKQSISARSD